MRNRNKIRKKGTKIAKYLWWAITMSDGIKPPAETIRTTENSVVDGKLRFKLHEQETKNKIRQVKAKLPTVMYSSYPQDKTTVTHTS